MWARQLPLATDFFRKASGVDEVGDNAAETSCPRSPVRSYALEPRPLISRYSGRSGFAVEPYRSSPSRYVRCCRVATISASLYGWQFVFEGRPQASRASFGWLRTYLTPCVKRGEFLEESPSP